ncbi:SecY-interacting protein [Alteromonas gilva]|uniref:SecY-interacting protein n=1 Tax=Alteromonas gilva TaxID=2987522 RepID=A0ABT5L038_9ALTE|nr:SecY-interacting protein [Alteromonas gilva]MDC8830386.1 SecY-interacting protein [Alteromonas gilva]
MENIVQKSLHKLMLELQQAAATQPQLMTTEFDPELNSPCYTTHVEAGQPCQWQPVLMTIEQSFANIENALDITLNEQFCKFFTTYWSFNLQVRAEQGDCELLQVCSEDDFARLQENLIGHLLMKQRLKQPPTLFFGLTDEDDFILSVDNASGEVVVEQVGKIPQRCLAPDLASFLDGLTPPVLVC